MVTRGDRAYTPAPAPAPVALAIDSIAPPREVRRHRIDAGGIESVYTLAPIPMTVRTSLTLHVCHFGAAAAGMPVWPGQASTTQQHV